MGKTLSLISSTRMVLALNNPEYAIKQINQTKQIFLSLQVLLNRTTTVFLQEWLWR